MNQNQINQVKAVIETYFSLDAEKLMSDAYKNKKDIDSVQFGEFTADELMHSMNLIFKNFKNVLDTTYVKSIPYQYNFQNEYGGGNLHSDLNQIVAYIQANQFANIPPFLNRAIHYQATIGIWDKKLKRNSKAEQISLDKEADRIKLVSEHLNSVMSTSDQFFTDLRNKEKELDNFINQKRSQLSEIESMLEASRQHVNEITELNSTSTSLTEKNSALHESNLERDASIKNLLSSIKNQQNASGKLTDQIQSTYNEYVKILSELNTDFDEALNIVKSKTEYFEERNEYLNDLIGREVGASLFETFKQRKKELASSVTFWKWSVPAMTIATIFWIFFLFGNGDISELTIELFAINTLKTIPAIFLLLFSISQYSKERHFQEEYAFKSAVALTVNAYADQLMDTNNKDKLIMDSVTEIYKTPMEQPKSKEKDSKTAVETAKGLADVAKSLASRS